MKFINKNFKKNYLKNILILILTFSIIFSLIFYPTIAKSGITNGLKYCTQILVPSLFPFIFISRFIVSSNMLNFLEKPLNNLSKTIFYLPASTFPVLILSILGGYPVGASGVKNLYEKKQINEEQLNRMMCYCVNAGPAFLISVVGISLLKNIYFGIMILILQTFFSLICAIICGIIARIKKIPFYCKNSFESKKVNFTQAFVDSTEQSCKSIIDMCGLILIFNFIIAIILNFINFLNFNKLIQNNFLCFIISFFEITSGCLFSVNHHIYLPIICFAISYGGICTHFQIISILRNTNFRYFKFHIFRIINATFSLITSAIFLEFFNFSIQTFISTKHSFEPSISSTILGSTFLLVLCIYFILNQNKTSFTQNSSQ